MRRMGLVSWITKKIGVSKEVADAMTSSAEGEARARDFREEIKEVIDPLRPVLGTNHFEEAIQRTYQRRVV
jgi:hypothetical protein